MNSFLALLGPVSYYVETKKSVGSISANNTKGKDFSTTTDYNTLNKASHFTQKVNQSSAYSATIQYREPSSHNSHSGNDSIGREGNEYDEYSALLESNVMWVRRDVELKIITDLIYAFQVLFCGVEVDI